MIRSIELRILKISFFCLIITTFFVLSGCSKTNISTTTSNKTVIFDSLGNQLEFEEAPKKVVVLEASLAVSWILSGGKIIGISDEYDSYGLVENYGVSENIETIGTNKHPNTELIISLNPDFVIYSPDIEGESEAALTLKNAKYQVYAAKIDSFDDYLFCLKGYSKLNDSSTYEKYGLNVKSEIDKIISEVPKDKNITALFMRARSSGVKIIGEGHMVSDILNDLNVQNIAISDKTLIGDFSMEKVVEKDPDYIFVVLMGTTHKEETEAMLKEKIYNDPSWSNLKAIKDDHYYVLPSNLFHFKPNERWAEAYQYIFDLVYGKLS